MNVRWLAVAPLGLTLLGCNGMMWPASMEQQTAVQPLDEARLAPPGSIPLGGVEVLEDREDDKELPPPSPLDAAASRAGFQALRY